MGYATTNTQGEYLRAGGLARLLGVSRNTIWRWTREGRLPPSIKLAGHVTVWSRADIDAFCNQMRQRGVA